MAKGNTYEICSNYMILMILSLRDHNGTITINNLLHDQSTHRSEETKSH